VQQAMLNVAREVIARYSQHDSFGGLALQLGPDGYAQLPGEGWGYDDRTIAAFQRAANMVVPGGGPQRFAVRARYLEGPGREAWVAWRAAVVADFHRRLKSEIATAQPRARLYLAGGTMLEDRQTLFRLRPTLPRRARFEEALKELGFPLPAYRDDPAIVLLRPQLLRPTAAPPLAQALHNDVYLAGEMDRLFAPLPQRATLFYHEPQKARLAGFDAESPFGPENTYTWLVSEMSPAGDRNRRRFVHSLAVEDAREMFDGGWLLALGQEAALGEVLSVYRQLPAERFETLPGEFQPLVIRTLARDGQTYFYVVNDSPWEVSLTLELDIPPECTLERLGASKAIGPLARPGGLATCNISLAPYDLAAARLSTPQARLRNPVVSVPQNVRPALQRKIDELVARLATLSRPEPLSVIENTGFEAPPRNEQIAGWTVAAAAGTSVALDSQTKHGGEKSLRLTSTGPRVSIASTPFDPPHTGRLAVEVWLRAADAQQPPPVRIAVEGEMREGVFDPHGVIDRVGQSARSPGDWVRYSFPIDTMPSEGLSNLRVRLELMGPGEVWIDDVQGFDLSFSEQERLELSKIVSLASVHLEKGQYSDCARLLESYWPQFLLTHVPPSALHTPIARRPLPPPPEPEKKRSMLDNIKSYFR
jgi:hypothetical protein